MNTGNAYRALLRRDGQLPPNDGADTGKALREFEALRASHTELLAALRELLSVSDKYSAAIDAARAAIAAATKE